jgi:hypothetical protein
MILSSSDHRDSGRQQEVAARGGGGRRYHLRDNGLPRELCQADAVRVSDDKLHRFESAVATPSNSMHLFSLRISVCVSVSSFLACYFQSLPAGTMVIVRLVIDCRFVFFIQNSNAHDFQSGFLHFRVWYFSVPFCSFYLFFRDRAVFSPLVSGSLSERGDSLGAQNTQHCTQAYTRFLVGRQR